MARTQRLRNAVEGILDTRGEMTTGDIYEHLNERFSWGTTMAQLGNILSRDPRFTKTGNSIRREMGLKYAVTTWRLSTTYNGQKTAVSS